MHAISVGSLLLAPLIETHHRIDDFQVLSVQLQSCPDPAMSGAKYKFEKEIVSVKFGASWGGTAVVQRGARVCRLGKRRSGNRQLDAWITRPCRRSLGGLFPAGVAAEKRLLSWNGNRRPSPTART